MTRVNALVLILDYADIPLKKPKIQRIHDCSLDRMC